MSLISASSVLSVVLFIVAPLAATILVGMLTRGRVRALGIAGFGLFVVEGVFGALWLFVLPQIGRGESVSMTVLAGVYSAVRGLIGLAALALLALAVITDRHRALPQAPPAAYPY